MRKNIKKIIILLLVTIVPLVTLASVTSVQTNPAQNVTHVHATLFGTVHSSDANFIAKFRYSVNAPPRCGLMQNYTEVNATVGVEDIGLYSTQQDILNLLPSTTYYFCALAYNPNGPIRYGDIFSFTTNPTPPPPPPPTVDPNGGSGILVTIVPITGIQTLGANPVEDTTATIHGSTGSGAKYVYFRYSAMPRPPVFCNQIYGTNMRYTGDLKPVSGPVKADLTELEPDTTYYYCLIASNDTTISYGSGSIAGVKSFHTKPCKTCKQTTIITKPANVLSKSSADLKGEYGSTKIVTTYFEYKKAPAQGVAQEGGGGGIGTSWTKTTEEKHDANTYNKIHFVVKGLTPDTMYEFRAVARTDNPTETLYAENILLFKTPKSDNPADDIVSAFDPNACPNGPTGVAPCIAPPLDCPAGTTGTPPDCLPPGSSCEDQGLTGTPPNCVAPPLQCLDGWTGTYPYCVPPPPTCAELNLTGTYPNCDYPVLTCTEMGLTGTYPNCQQPPPSCVDLGMTGTYPNCVGPVNTCADMGLTGTYPNCVPPPPTCVDLGMTGTYPSCVGPNGPVNTCTEMGLTGTYPNCVPPPPTCVDLGMTGTYPSCIGAVNSCADMGMTGTYPSCTQPPPNCEAMGLKGTYPNCTYPNDNGNNLSDIDHDGIPNALDPDIDGDGIPNNTDGDDDGDGILDGNDNTPNGVGNPNDYNGNGIPNNQDWDIDGDGIPNAVDPDVDGDGIPNNLDTDNDNDGIINISDTTPSGIGNVNDYDGDGILNNRDSTPRGGKKTIINTGNGNNSNASVLGETTTPPNDAIVRYHEGVETVFIRQIMHNTVLQQKYGYKTGDDLQAFANYLAHFFGKHYGYVAKNGKEVRVKYADVAAYELREVGNKTIVYESYLSKKTGNFEITGIRTLSGIFKTIFKYEYYFLKRR